MRAVGLSCCDPAATASPQKRRGERKTTKQHTTPAVFGEIRQPATRYLCVAPALFGEPTLRTHEVCWTGGSSPTIRP
jgi:hypothetical protein